MSAPPSNGASASQGMAAPTPSAAHPASLSQPPPQDPASQPPSAGARALSPPPPQKQGDQTLSSRSVGALRQAAEEGITLERSEGSSGYRFVAYDSRGCSKPYSGRVSRNGIKLYCGTFVTAEECALACWRALLKEEQAQAENGAAAVPNEEPAPSPRPSRPQPRSQPAPPQPTQPQQPRPKPDPPRPSQPPQPQRSQPPPQRPQAAAPPPASAPSSRLTMNRHVPAPPGPLPPKLPPTAPNPAPKRPNGAAAFLGAYDGGVWRVPRRRNECRWCGKIERRHVCMARWPKRQATHDDEP